MIWKPPASFGLRNVCALPVGVVISAELTDNPCSLDWWVQLVGFGLRASDLPQGHEILRDVQDLLARPSCAD